MPALEPAVFPPHPAPPDPPTPLAAPARRPGSTTSEGPSAAEVMHALTSNPGSLRVARMRVERANNLTSMKPRRAATKIILVSLPSNHARCAAVSLARLTIYGSRSRAHSAAEYRMSSRCRSVVSSPRASPGWQRKLFVESGQHRSRSRCAQLLAANAGRPARCNNQRQQRGA